MSIELFEGTPGSGKSYHSADKIYYWLRFGKRNVICNFVVDLNRIFLTRVGRLKMSLNAAFKINFKVYDSKPLKPNYFYCDNSDLNPAYLVKFANEHHKYRTMCIAGVEQHMFLEGQTTVIIDEAAVLFNCRLWQHNNREEWCEFFRQHRKYGFDIILITQTERLLDKQIRPLIETYVMHRNLKYFNWFAKLISFLSGGSTFICLYRWQGCRDIYHREICRYHSHIAAIYNSYLVFSVDSGKVGGASAGQGPRGRPTDPAAPKENEGDVLECLAEFLETES